MRLRDPCSPGRSADVSELGQGGAFLLEGEVNEATRPEGKPAVRTGSQVPGLKFPPRQAGSQALSPSRSPEVYISEMAPRLLRKTFPGL